MLIALPVYRINCKVAIDKGRAWSIAEECLLFAMSRAEMGVALLVEATGLPRQLVVASIARLMRFRLVEVALQDDGAVFRASVLGERLVHEGIAMPYYPKRFTRRVSFLVDWATGSVCSNRGVQLLTRDKLAHVREAGDDVLEIKVEGAGPAFSHSANFARLSEISARAWDEQLAEVYSRTTSVRSDEVLIVSAVNGALHGVPADASGALRDFLQSTANTLPRAAELVVAYRGPRESLGAPRVRCDFDAADLIVGGPAHKAFLETALVQAHRRLIVHSTFLNKDAFIKVLPAISAACREGLMIDILWGAESDDEVEHQSSRDAAAIMSLVRDDASTAGRVRVRMRSSGSHAKLLLFDRRDGEWVGVVGSCNWLSSPFMNVEVSAVLRDPRAVAQLAAVLQDLAGRRGLSDSIANEMAILGQELARRPEGSGAALAAVLVGDGHDAIAREASAAGRGRYIISSHRLGSVARPGAIMPAQSAAASMKAPAHVIYYRTSGPVRKRDARRLREDAAANGVELINTAVPIHGKFLAWGDSDIVITSLNWASAATQGATSDEVGVHLHCPGLVGHLLDQLIALVPELQDALLSAYRSAPPAADGGTEA